MCGEKSFTLVELLISITIAGIIAGVIILILDIGIMSWQTGEADILVQGVGQKILDEIIEGGFESSGIRECVEIVSAESNYICFVPLLADEHKIRGNLNKGAVFRLKKKLSPGSPIPFAKIKSRDDEEFHSVRISFIRGSRSRKGISDDTVKVSEPIQRGSRLRILYHPDASDSDVQVSYLWNDARQILLRTYYGDTQTTPTRSMGVKATGLKFTYFDADNTEIPVPSGSEQLQSISAVKVTLFAVKGDEKRELSSFVNIRNISNKGRGIAISEGSIIEIPDSRNIQSLVLTNIGGVENGDIIELEARPPEGDIWKIRVKFGIMPEASGEEKPKLLSFSIEYPPDRILWSRFLNQPVEQGLNLTNFGDSRYDYDDDTGIDDVVNLSGKVELVVTKMDVDSAAIAVQP